jgi:hypothetical protein
MRSISAIGSYSARVGGSLADSYQDLPGDRSPASVRLKPPTCRDRLAAGSLGSFASPAPAGRPVEAKLDDMGSRPMEREYANLPFEDWLTYLFDHPVAQPVWYWNVDFEEADLAPERVLTYSTRLFEESGERLARYPADQVNQGLSFLIDEAGSPLYALADSALPVAPRVRCIRSIAALFEQCFLPRCTPHLSHLDEAGAGALNAVYYMWWDVFPLHGKPEDPARREIDEACITVMAETLELPSVACRESALHGLGHWGLYYRDRCRAIVAAFLDRTPDLRPELRAYAECAREAYVL